MRIIAGKARGRRLVTLPGEHTRPTSDRAKEALFSILKNHLPDARVLDLFAGSGALGLESLSRGAASAVLVDNHEDCVRVIRENGDQCGLTQQCTILKAGAGDILRQLPATQPFDLVFMDPPYAFAEYEGILRLLFARKLVAPKGIVACEHARERSLDAEMAALEGLCHVRDRRVYGKAAYTFFVASQAGSADLKEGEGE